MQAKVPKATLTDTNTVSRLSVLHHTLKLGQYFTADEAEHRRRKVSLLSKTELE